MPSDDESDDDYRRRSRTPPSETFSHEEEHYRRRRRRSPSPRGLGNDAMSRALDQLSKSPFTHHIKGPYRITSVAGIGAYYLEDLDEKVVPRPWNVNNLKRYYY